MSKIVTSDIPFGSVYAYRRGDTIEDDAVEQNKWQDYVANPGTKAAREAQGLSEPDTTTTSSAPAGKDK